MRVNSVQQLVLLDNNLNIKSLSYNVPFIYRTHSIHFVPASGLPGEGRRLLQLLRRGDNQGRGEPKKL